MTGWRAWAIWATASIAVMAVVASSAIGAGGLDPVGIAVAALILAAGVASFAFVGAIVTVRLPGNPIGWILVASGTAIAFAILGTSAVTARMAGSTTADPATVLVALVSSVSIVPIIGAVGIFIPLLFPDGHLPSPRWRWAARSCGAAIVVATLLFLVMPGNLNGSDEIQNPLSLGILAGSGDAVGWLMFAVQLVPFVIGWTAVVARYRHGGPVERQQVKWFATAVALMFVGVFMGTSGIGPFGDANWLLMFVGLMLLPIAIGAAILRYRLYDIDRIVSRVIGYAIVTGILAVVFVGAILLFSAVLAPILGENPIAVAASTLIVAALFQPLRRRVQGSVDRRFNRARYDAERTTAAFADRLRDQVDLVSLRSDLVATVDSSLRPSAAGLWLRESAESVR